ncbi:MAG: hypothetical protein ACI81Y_001634 [Glaciecola sp.]|jgi:hypothetical protein
MAASRGTISIVVSYGFIEGGRLLSSPLTSTEKIKSSNSVPIKITDKE